jgi:L-lactate dehydrogenase complex protein LldG
VNGRDEVLSRIRTALGGEGPETAPRAAEDAVSPAGAAPGGAAPGGAARAGAAPGGASRADAAPGGEAGYGYRLRAEADAGELLDLLADRLTDYRAIVRRTTPSGLASAIGEALTQRGARRVVVPPGLELPALPPGMQALTDSGFSPNELDTFDGAVTAAAVAIAETGTIVLDGSPDQGRRAITLVPDYHLCVVRSDQVVALVPEAIARLRQDRSLTWISGPSATSDIELERVEGVHGPRTLEVILVAGS